jgi:hypothetical protein
LKQGNDLNAWKRSPPAIPPAKNRRTTIGMILISWDDFSFDEQRGGETDEP